eukprot:2085075-Rhodomonas_salina.1
MSVRNHIATVYNNKGRCYPRDTRFHDNTAGSLRPRRVEWTDSLQAFRRLEMRSLSRPIDSEEECAVESVAVRVQARGSISVVISRLCQQRFDSCLLALAAAAVRYCSIGLHEVDCDNVLELERDATGVDAHVVLKVGCVSLDHKRHQTRLDAVRVNHNLALHVEL